MANYLCHPQESNPSCSTCEAEVIAMIYQDQKLNFINVKKSIEHRTLHHIIILTLEPEPFTNLLKSTFHNFSRNGRVLTLFRGF